MVLPDYEPETEVVEIHGIDGCYPMGQVFHPIVKLPDGRVAVDVWVSGDRVLGRAWRRQDHPNLKNLPAGTPKSVKSIYTAAGQLAYMRMTECFGSPVVAAHDWASDNV